MTLKCTINNLIIIHLQALVYDILPPTLEDGAGKRDFGVWVQSDFGVEGGGWGGREFGRRGRVVAVVERDRQTDRQTDRDGETGDRYRERQRQTDRYRLKRVESMTDCACYVLLRMLTWNLCWSLLSADVCSLVLCYDAFTVFDCSKIVQK